MFIGHIYQRNQEYQSKSYLNKICYGLYEALKNAAKYNHENQFRELIFFYRRQLYNSRKNGSVSAFTELWSWLIRLYPILDEKYRNFLVDTIAISFREPVFGSISSAKWKIKKVERDAIKDNYFNEIIYWSALHVIQQSIIKRDYENFEKIFEELNQITSTFDFNRQYDGVLKVSVVGEGNERNLFLHQSVYFITFSWLMFMYQYDKISFQEFQNFEIEKNLSEGLLFYQQNSSFYEMFVKLKEEVFKGLYEIESWELEKHPSGKAYVALQARTWLNFGFTIFLLKYSQFTRIARHDKIGDYQSLRYLTNDFNEVIKILDSDLTKSEKKWRHFIFPQMTHRKVMKAYKDRKDIIYNTFKEIKKVQEFREYEDIVSKELSDDRIKEFQQEVFSAFDMNNTIIHLLKEYDVINYKPNDEKINGVGFFPLLQQMKFSFVEEGQDIIGLSDFGSRLARSIEMNFFESLNLAKNFINTRNLELELNQFISKQEHPENLIIFTDWGGVEKIGGIEYVEDEQMKFFKYKYKEIPVVSHVSLNNSLVVIDLKASINCTIYQKDDWFDKELMIEVNEVTKEVLEDEMEKYEEKWKILDGYELTKEEAELVIRSSLLLKIIYKYDLDVKNTESYLGLKY